jgi:hypothetical protein
MSRITNWKDGTDHKVKVGSDEYAHRYFDVNLAKLADAQALEERVLLPIERWLGGA